MRVRFSRRQWLLLGVTAVSGGGRAAGQSNLTPAGEFFVRNHFEAPNLSMATWRLRVEGQVARPLELSFSDLLESPGVKKVESVLECAGNGATGNGLSAGVWQGIALGKLLEEAGADPAGNVLLEGSDEGQLRKGAPPTPYRRVVPQSKCRAPECLVAFKLNDRYLPASNGFPARAVLPGWYGMDSVKWLRRIVVLRRGELPSGYSESGMTQLYARLRPGAEPERITRIQVKSMIAYPQEGAKLPAARCLVKGYAWTGEASVARVEVSADGGKSWNAARLEGSPRPFTWVEWSYAWQAPAGEHVLLSRARDSAGRAQPLVRDASRLDSYELNWCAPVRCTVK